MGAYRVHLVHRVRGTHMERIVRAANQVQAIENLRRARNEPHMWQCVEVPQFMGRER